MHRGLTGVYMPGLSRANNRFLLIPAMRPVQGLRELGGPLQYAARFWLADKKRLRPWLTVEARSPGQMPIGRDTKHTKEGRGSVCVCLRYGEDLKNFNGG